MWLAVCASFLQKIKKIEDEGQGAEGLFTCSKIIFKEKKKEKYDRICQEEGATNWCDSDESQ